LDGDDTLWHNESVFSMTHDRFRRLLAPYATPAELDRRLFDTEMANLGIFGYGVKAFMLSMIETAIELSAGALAAAEVQQIIDAGKQMLVHPVELLVGVEAALDALAGRYRLILITKGDLFDQESKLARSGLGDRFWRVAVVAKKDAPTYRRVLSQHGVEAATFLMVGDSVQSDILPVLEIGAAAVHVPYPLVWEHERAEPVGDHPRLWELDTIASLPALLDQLDGGSS
jgi:putative hydrolase of the HAD superfamily